MRNKFEKAVSATLTPDWQYEKVKLTYTLECTYLPDWTRDGELLEAKGYLDSADRRKLKAIRQQYPDLKMTIVFQNPNRKISKQSKTSYSDWCDRVGIAWRSL